MKSNLQIMKASAGSGKTYTLARKYISLLLESPDRYAYRHILAVTFTNKATDEMKSRIVDECIQLMSPACIDIITQFYYHGKSLDEIMVTRGGKNSSKDGLKTAKNKCMNTLRERVLKEYSMCNL